MKKNGIISLIVIASVFILTGAAAFSFYKSTHFANFFEWSQQNLILFFIVLTTLKFVALIYPPIPGGILTIASIPILGWYYAFLADFAGGLLGASVSYYLGYRYGHKIAGAFLTPATLSELKQIKVNQKNEIEAVIILKTFGGTLVEAINYGAGIIKIRYKSFLIGYIIAQPLYGIPTFYFAGNIFSGKNLILNILFILVVIPLFYKLKGRYLE